MSFFTGRIVQIDYTNWKGERRVRRIVPREIKFKSSEYHPQEQWVMLATCLESGQQREFAMSDIHTWKQADDQSLPYR